MKNDFRNDGTHNMGWLADGDVTDRLDGQGFLKEQPEKSAPMSDYERLAAALYDHALNYDDRAQAVLAELFEDMGFNDLAHQVYEGIRDAEKTEREEASADGGWRTGPPLAELYAGTFSRLIGLDEGHAADAAAYVFGPKPDEPTEGLWHHFLQPSRQQAGDDHSD